MRAVDTNVLVRLLARDDAKQTAAAKAFVESGVWVSTLVLAEVFWVLGTTYRVPPVRQADALEMLLENAHMEIENRDAVQSALVLFRARPDLGFSDCLILEMARKAGHLPLGTFDRKLSSIPGVQRIV